jgi:glucosamine--fructose-6-phosphate aminotransferase (isomerizing)
MCGIVGIVQQDTNKIGKNIIDSLKKLEYRGYDSVGIATIDNNQVREYQRKKEKSQRL